MSTSKLLFQFLYCDILIEYNDYMLYIDDNNDMINNDIY